MTNKREEGKSERTVSYEGLVFVVLLSLALIAAGLVMCYDPNLLSFENICTITGAGFIIFGLFKIITYLRSGAYRTITDYNFTVGLICASAGVCVIILAPGWGQSGISFLGVCVLIDAVVMIQYALQINFMEGKTFPVVLAMAAGVYIFAMLAIIEPWNLFYLHVRLFAALMSFSGALGLISMGLVWARSRNLSLEEKRDSMRMLEDEPVTEHAVDDASYDAESDDQGAYEVFNEDSDEDSKNEKMKENESIT